MASDTEVPSDQGLIDSVHFTGSQAERSIEEEREHRKRKLVAALRIFSDMGFDEGVAGHLTARDPGDPDAFWVNPYALHFSRVKLSDLVLVRGDGSLEGKQGYRVNKAAFQIHHAIHETRPDVVSAAHCHTKHGRAWSTMGRPLSPIVQEACAFYNNMAVVSDYDGLVVEQDQGSAVAEALGDKRAVTLMHHGNITVGGSVEEAAWWFITMERCCEIQLMAEASGKPIELPPKEATLASRQFGSNNKARLSFDMLYEVAVDKHTDMFD